MSRLVMTPPLLSPLPICHQDSLCSGFLQKWGKSAMEVKVKIVANLLLPVLCIESYPGVEG